MYLDQQGEVIENATLIGARAAAVPGTVAGMWAAHQRYGSLPWRELIKPAIELARQGFMPARFWLMRFMPIWIGLAIKPTLKPIFRRSVPSSFSDSLSWP